MTAGSRTGEVVQVSLEGYLYETNRTLVQLYEDWLDRELERFQKVEVLMKSRLTLDEINKQVRDQVEMIDAGDIIASIANAEKPVELSAPFTTQDLSRRAKRRGMKKFCANGAKPITSNQDSLDFKNRDSEIAVVVAGLLGAESP